VKTDTVTFVTIGKANWEHGFLNHWYSI